MEITSLYPHKVLLKWVMHWFIVSFLLYVNRLSNVQTGWIELIYTNFKEWIVGTITVTDDKTNSSYIFAENILVHETEEFQGREYR